MADDARWPPFAAAARVRGILSSLSVPLVAHGQPLGALNIYASDPHAHDEEALRRAQPLSRQAAVALANACAHDTMKSAVVALQRGLLPQRLPQLPGFTVAARYRPASAQALVGGDWYDAVPVGPHDLAVTIGDVAGHGFSAAATMARFRTALRASPARDIRQAAPWICCTACSTTCRPRSSPPSASSTSSRWTPATSAARTMRVDAALGASKSGS